MSNSVSLFNGLIKGEWSNHVSSSQRSSWNSCRLRTALSSAAHVTTRDRGIGAKGLLVGTLVHSVLGQHYRTDPSERSEGRLHAWLDAQSVAGGYDEAVRGQAITRAHTMLERYYKRYGRDGIVPLEIEASLTRRLPSGVDYIGYADMIYEADGMIVVEDFKTSLSTIDPTKHTVFNPQGRDYLWALSQTYDPQRLVMSWLLMTPASVRRIQTPIGPIWDSEHELDSIAREERTLDITPNYDIHCLWCPYRQLCETHLTGGDVKDTFERFYVQGVAEVEAGDDTDE